MILQALYELAQAEELIGDADYEYKPISWVVRLREDGTLIGIEDHRRNLNEGKTGRNGKPIKAKWAGKDQPVPVQPIRTSGDCAFFLVDKTEYVFGIDPNGARPAEKLAARAALFREQVEACAAETGDPGIKAVAAFLQAAAKDPSKIGLPAEAAPNDLFAFKVGDGPFVHLRPAVKEWWKQKREIGESAGDARFRCLVTGEPLHEVELFPLVKRVPGGTPSGVALVSHNASAFESYGFSGNDNAPVSRAASQAAATTLNRLLDPEPINGRGERLARRNLKLSSDTVVVYWSPGGDPDALDALVGLTEAESADAVADAYRSVWQGQPPSLKDSSRFYAMTLTGTQGRVVVRAWLETNLAQVMQNLARHFEHLNIVRNTSPPRGKPQTPAVPLRMLLDALAAPGRDAQVPAALAASVIHAALYGTAYPTSILQRALLRERAEVGSDEWIGFARRDARAALIKAVLIRQGAIQMEIAMNPGTDSDGYQLGMLTAVLERLQAIAIDNANATLVDRFFAAASATPAAVFPRLLKLARHHARKAVGSDKPHDRVLAARYDRLIDAIATRFNIDPRRYPPPTGAFPNHLPLPEQGLFVLGYHQMRHWLWMNEAERAEWEQEHPDAPRAFLWKTGNSAAAQQTAAL